jgi:hypothetical protein
MALIAAHATRVIDESCASSKRFATQVVVRRPFFIITRRPFTTIFRSVTVGQVRFTKATAQPIKDNGLVRSPARLCSGRKLLARCTRNTTRIFIDGRARDAVTDVVRICLHLMVWADIADV